MANGLDTIRERLGGKKTWAWEGKWRCQWVNRQEDRYLVFFVKQNLKNVWMLVPGPALDLWVTSFHHIIMD